MLLCILSIIIEYSRKLACCKKTNLLPIHQINTTVNNTVGNNTVGTNTVGNNYNLRSNNKKKLSNGKLGTNKHKHNKSNSFKKNTVVRNVTVQPPVNVPPHVNLLQTIINNSQLKIQSIDDSSYEYTSKIINNTAENKLLPLSLLDDSIAKDICVICQDCVQWKSRPVIRLTCNHYFHYSCCQPLIDDFMQQNLIKYVFNEPINDTELFGIKCPICRETNSHIENVYINYLDIESSSDSDESFQEESQLTSNIIYV
jgi:hypothetical protein